MSFIFQQMVCSYKLFHYLLFISILFVFAFVWNWITLETGRAYPKPLLLDVVDLPNRIMKAFEFLNSTLLSPEGQDMRWNEYSKYYQEYQSKLTKTDLEYYVVYTTTYSGLANKLNGLVSSLLIAMVTNRGFLCRRYVCCFTVSG